jgi:hypothetical protein
MSWHYRGTPHYLDAQARRLKVSPLLAHRARHNPEIYHASVLMSQLCERYHRARTEDGRKVFEFRELEQVKGALDQAEGECDKLHALAATAQAMLDEAYAAWGLPAKVRHFQVLCDYDEPTSTAQPDDDLVAAALAG